MFFYFDFRPLEDNPTMSKSNKGADGFKEVKSAKNKKIKAPTVNSVMIEGSHYEVGMLLDTTGKKNAIASTARGEVPTAKLCRFFKMVGPSGNDCSKQVGCYNIHLVSERAVVAQSQSKANSTVLCGVYHQHDKLHIGVDKGNTVADELAGVLCGLCEDEVGTISRKHETEDVDVIPKAPSDPNRVVIAIDPTGTRLRDDAFSCELKSVIQQDGTATKQVLAFTSYVPNFVDQGIQMKTLTPSALDRASRLLVPHYLHTPVKLWGRWAENISFNTDNATSAIAATKYYDVTVAKESGGKQTIFVVGESAEQPKSPICIEDVQLTHTIDYATSNTLIHRSMPDTTSISAAEYFKLPADMIPCVLLERALSSPTTHYVS